MSTATPFETETISPASVDARKKAGAAARAATPRRSHGQFQPARDRADPIDVLEAQAASRVPELVPVRYGRMLTSPFAFFRGAAAIMARDLAAQPNTGLTTQLCGDAHLSNFGIFASPERRLVFDINDFDETLPGPFEWDVKRLSASLAIAGRGNGYGRSSRARIIEAAIREYRVAMRRFAGLNDLDLWYLHLNDEDVLRALHQVNRRMVKGTKALFKTAQTSDSMQAVGKLTTMKDGRRRIISSPPLIVPLEDLPGAEPDLVTRIVDETLDGYAQSLAHDRRHLLSQYRYVHAAQKVVGVGSVGTRAFAVLLEGRDSNDVLFLQMKEAQRSVLDGLTGPCAFDNEGERVVAGQRLMQAVSDVFLGWHRTSGAFDGVRRDYYVRQLKDWKGSVEVERARASQFVVYGRFCAWTLARAHARSGDRVAIAAYLGGSNVFELAMADFAEAYADQNDRDFAALLDASESGRVQVLHGV